MYLGTREVHKSSVELRKGAPSKRKWCIPSKLYRYVVVAHGVRYRTACFNILQDWFSTIAHGPEGRLAQDGRRLQKTAIFFKRRCHGYQTRGRMMLRKQYLHLSRDSCVSCFFAKRSIDRWRRGGCRGTPCFGWSWFWKPTEFSEKWERSLKWEPSVISRTMWCIREPKWSCGTPWPALWEELVRTVMLHLMPSGGRKKRYTLALWWFL